MTASGADRGAGHWAVRGWQCVRHVSNRTPLRTKLIAALLALVTFALIAMGFAGISLLRGQLLAPYNDELKGLAGSPRLWDCVNQYVDYGTANCPPEYPDVYLLTSA